MSVKINMKLIRFIITSVYLSLFIFLAASLFLGDTSYKAYDELESYKETLAANVKELENINHNLKKQCEALGSSEGNSSEQIREQTQTGVPVTKPVRPSYSERAYLRVLCTTDACFQRSFICSLQNSCSKA